MPVFPLEETSNLSQENSESALEIFMAMGDISKYQDKRLLSALSEIGVNPAQYSYLYVLCTVGKMNLGELAQRLHVENPTASVTVKRMESAGLVERHADPCDSRLVWITATDWGFSQFRRAKIIVADYISQVFGGFSEKDAFLLYHLLCRIRENAKNYIPNFPKGFKLMREGNV